MADLAYASTPDRQIWAYAKKNALVVVTKDEDFSHLCLLDPAPAAVVWVRVPNCSRSALLGWFSPLLPSIIGALERGEHLIELV